MFRLSGKLKFIRLAEALEPQDTPQRFKCCYGALRASRKLAALKQCGTLILRRTKQH